MTPPAHDLEWDHVPGQIDVFEAIADAQVAAQAPQHDPEPDAQRVEANRTWTENT